MTMKLFIAISGKNKEDVIKKLLIALENPDEFIQDNCFSEEYDESRPIGDPERIIYQLDYHWIEGKGDENAFLAELLD